MYLSQGRSASFYRELFSTALRALRNRQILLFLRHMKELQDRVVREVKR
jgi:hypothetical protein